MKSREPINRCDDCAMRQCGLLKDIPEKIFRRLSCTMTPYKYPARQLIFFEGNPCHQVGSIRTGVVKLSKHGSNGKTQIIGLVGPGHVLGYEAFQDRPYRSTAVALSDVELCMTASDNFARLIRDYPDIGMGFVRLLCGRIDELEQQIFRLGTFSARQRLAAWLLSNAAHGSRKAAELAATPDMSRQEIADTLGMAKETLIRLLMKFSSQGVVSVNGAAIAVRNQEKLMQVLSS